MRLVFKLTVIKIYEFPIIFKKRNNLHLADYVAYTWSDWTEQTNGKDEASLI